MSQTTKIVLAVIITAAVVGGGVYFWQQQKIATIKTTTSGTQEASKQPAQNFTTENKPDIETQPKIQINLVTYSSEKYSFRHPQGYFVSEPPITENVSFPVLTVRKAANQKEADADVNAMIASNNRLEIFQMKDFGDRPWGFSGEETQEGVDDGYVPKDMLTVGTGDKKYDVWLYYSKNDSITKKELMAIFDSIVIK